jgi:YegS/Rv2252/BmrU family lipid kinase
MKIYFIINPKSGRRSAVRLQPTIDDFAKAHKLDYTIVLTEGPYHATKLAKEALQQGFERIIAVGGDGTMNEVAQALLHQKAALGLIPCGSGNGLARFLKLPSSPVEALKIATSKNAYIKTIDTGTVNGLPFFNVMGLGLDADVSQRFNSLPKRGLPSYTKAAIQAFLGRKTEHCIVESDGDSYPLDVLLISIANSNQYGNGAIIAPKAEVDDGLLDLIAIKPIGIMGALSLATKLFSGTIDRSIFVKKIEGRHFTITRTHADIIHTDGESHQSGKTVNIEVVSRSLRIACSSKHLDKKERTKAVGNRTQDDSFSLML